MQRPLVLAACVILSLIACTREPSQTSASAQPAPPPASTPSTPAGAAAQVPAAAVAAGIKGVPAGTVMPDAYLETVGRMAYLWGWPLVNNLNRALAVSQLPGPGRNGGIVPVAPPGSISMLTDYMAPGQKFITCPNQDTVYGSGYQHVDTQPVIVQVPDFGDRFFTYQIVDARTDSFCSIGKQYGTKPGFYLLAGPNWKGEVPAGVTDVCRSSTDLVTVLPRAFMDDTAEDRAAIQPVLRQIMVYPLAQFDGTMKTTDWHKTPEYPMPADMASGEIQWVVPEKFFDELPQVLAGVPPLPGEEALYTQMRGLLDAAAKDPKIKDKLTQIAVKAEAELINPLFEFRNNGRPVGNGWTSPPNGAAWGVDYLSRTASAKSNMYDNAPQETRYIYTDFDSRGGRLDGRSGAYTVTFAKGQTPPVKGFWSLTMYNKHHLFEPNALNRFSLGTKNKNLQYGDDGSLTFYVQHERPAADRESNWLPAPADEFSLYLRAYWPEQAILDGSWQPPTIEKVR